MGCDFVFMAAVSCVGTMPPPIARSASIAATPMHSRSQAEITTPSVPMATPKFNPHNVTAATPGLRSARKGETLMSINGSPVAV